MSIIKWSNYPQYSDVDHEDSIFFTDCPRPMAKPECITCGPTTSPRFDQNQWGLGFTNEHEERFRVWFLMVFQVVAPYFALVINAVNGSYYLQFGSSNDFLEISFFRDYWEVVYPLSPAYAESFYLSKHEEGVILGLSREKYSDLLMEYFRFFCVLPAFQEHLNDMFSFKPLLSVMLVLFDTNDGEIDCEITDYFLRRYYSNSEEYIDFKGDSFDDSFIEFGLILILFSLFMCDLLVV